MGTARNARCAKPYSARSTAVLMDDARSIQAAARKINSPYDRFTFAGDVNRTCQ